MAQKIILDTDIGDDIDDALALALICACPELELVGITTVFANVQARSRQARSLLQIAGERFATIPVAAGCGASMASRPLHNNRSYLEGVLPNQDSTCLPEAELAPSSPQHGVDFLIDHIMGGDGDIIPITIGAMTNLATAMVKERKIVAKIPRIISMAAEFKTHMAEWNILCDPEAAHLVFSSGIPVQVTTWEMGRIAQFTDEDIERLKNAPHPLGHHLWRTIVAWQNAGHFMPALYDPHAVATLLHPELVEWKTGRVRVELQGQHTYGFTHFEEDPNGPHRVAWNTDRDQSIAFYLERILAFDRP